MVTGRTSKADPGLLEPLELLQELDVGAGQG